MSNPYGIGMEGLGELPAGREYVTPGVKTPRPSLHRVYAPVEGCDANADWLLGVLRVALQENLIVSEQSPHIHPPFRGSTLNLNEKHVLIPGPPGPTADASTAASMLQLIENAQPLASGQNFADAFQLAVPLRQIAIINEVGVTFGSQGAESEVTVQVLVNGIPQTDFGNGGIPMGSSDLPERVFISARERQIISVRVRNTSTIVPHLVCVKVKGWTFPVKEAMDSLNSWLLREERQKGCL